MPNGSFVSFVDGARQPANGALLWLKADVGAGTPGAGVSTWIDQSGADNTLSPVSSLPMLTAGSASSFNFNPSVMFNGSSDALASGTSPLVSISGESTLFVVTRERVRQNNLLFDLSNSLSNRFMAHYPWSDNALYWDIGACCNAPNQTNAAAPFAVGQTSIGVFSDSVSNNRKEIIVNSAVLANSGSGVMASGLVQTRIGGSQGLYYNGQASEVLAYNRYLSQTERNTVESYLALKYGITLDRGGVGGAYVNRNGGAVYSDSGTYWNDIAGIGRDSGSTLDQRISKSSNTTSVLTLATSADMTSLNGGSRPSLTDGQYLVLGSNTANTAFGSAWSGGSGGSGRMNRVWKVQNTGSVGAITLGLPNTLSSSAPTLLVSTSADFSSGVTPIPMNATGAFWTASATLPNGSFVSFSDATGAVGGSALWLKADLGVSGGASIASWTDQSGSGMTATGINGPALVSNGYNYNPTVRFAGGGNSGAPSGGYFSLPSGFSDWSSGVSAYAVVKPSSNAPSYQRIFDFGNGASSDNLLLDQSGTSNAVRFDIYGSSMGTITGPPGSFSTGAVQLIGVNETASGALSLYQNSVLIQSGTGATLRNVVRTLNYIGRSNWAVDGMLAGDLSELIIYNKTNAATERSQIESYLALKYGLTLGDSDATAGSNTPSNYVNSSGVTIWNGSANSAYHNDIAGIGRDSGSTLDQRISKSVSSTSLMTIATSADMTNANGGSRPSLAEGQYLVLGSNTANTAFGSAWSGSNGRMNRVWKVQNTGSVGGAIPAIPGSIAFPSGIPVVLIESSSGSGSFATATTKAYPLGKQGNFWMPVSAVGGSSPQAVSLPDGAYVSYGVAGLPISLIETSIGGSGVFTFSLTNADTDLTTPAQDSTATITTSAPATPTPYDANASLVGIQPIQAIQPNVDVVLTINPVAGWTLNPNSFCSDGSNTFPLTGNTVVLPAAKLVLGAALTCNIGHTRIGLAVSGRVFVDNGAGNGGANNGVVDGTEQGLPGVAMQLTNCAGTVYATGASDGNGAYTLAFPNNFASNACVVQGPVAGYLSTGANVSGMALQDGAAWQVGSTRYLWTRTDRSIAFAVNANTSYADVNF